MNYEKIRDRIIKILYHRLGNFNDINVTNSLACDTILQGVRLKGDIKLGEKVKLIGGVHISGQVSIGRYTVINGPNTDIFSKIYPVEVGSFCSIARGVSIQEYNHRMDRVSTYFMDTNLFEEGNIDNNIHSKGQVVIMNDVWIGAQSVILSGAVIDNGAVIAANSVVTGYVPPYAIVGGTPAKIIGYRFGTETIKILNELQWWNWEIEDIKKRKSLFQDKVNIEALKAFV